MGALALALVLSSSNLNDPDAAFDDAPGPRWPGIVAEWMAGSILTIETMYGAAGLGNLSCFTCPATLEDDPLFQTSMMTSSGIIIMLGGMMYLAWAQPPEEPWPKSPGVLAIASGAIEIAGAVIRSLMASGSDLQRGHQYLSCGIIAGSGAVALVAGLVWVALTR
jgi:hypothetical protein